MLYHWLPGGKFDTSNAFAFKHWLQKVMCNVFSCLTCSRAVCALVPQGLFCRLPAECPSSHLLTSWSWQKCVFVPSGWLQW